MSGRPARLIRHEPRSSTALRGIAVALAGLAAVLGARDLVLVGHAFGDTASYWLAWHGPTLYDASAPLWTPHFIYAPPAALALWPLAQLPETVFDIAWTTLGIGAYCWLLAPLPLEVRIPGLLAGTLFALGGNIEWLLAVAVVGGMRWPAVWLIALFTKVAPFLGFGWFLLRGEWRSATITLAIGVALVALSAALMPDAWQTWIRMVSSLASQTEAPQTLNPIMPAVPFVLRFVAAAALLWWGARHNQPLVLPFVLALCQPDMQPWAFGYLAALPRLYVSAALGAKSA